ncbi:MAG TPA: HEPN domain-containing protein [Sedimentisphaerales bacterium]|nr:HEPN domain-containing protein [Sedimentisphaerales bacterium]
MNEGEARKTLIALWLEKAEEALASAQLELNAGHTNFAVNRLYYACFYAVTALLL